MTADPRAALARLVSALERHLEVASAHRDPDDPAVVSAAEALAEAFDDYDEALFEATEVATPLAVYGDEDEDYDEDEDSVVSGSDDVSATGVYAGLDDEDVEYDVDDDDDDLDDDDDADDDADDDNDDDDLDDDDADDDDEEEADA